MRAFVVGDLDRVECQCACGGGRLWGREIDERCDCGPLGFVQRGDEVVLIFGVVSTV